MQVTKVVCPLCQGVSKVNDAVPVGSSLHCQQCGAPFTVGEGDIRQPHRGAERRSAVLAEAPVAEAAGTSAWWVEEQVPVAPRKPASIAVAQPFRPPPTPVTPVAQAVVAGPPAAPTSAPQPTADSPAPAGHGVNPLLALVLGGGMLLVLGLAVTLAVICCLSPKADEPDSVAQAPPIAKKRPQKPAQPLAPTGSPDLSVARKVDQLSTSSPQWHPAFNPAEEDTGVVVVSRRERDPLDALPVPPKVAQQPKDPFLDPIKIAQPPPPTNKHVVTPAKQKEIDAAIAKGVAFLKSAQQGDGTWRMDNGHPLGTTALVTLALFECGVPATDPSIASAAAYVRKHWQQTTATYDISLTILLLDKLAEKKDKLIIQALALRLIHSQNSVGGWTYNVTILTNQEAAQLLATLKKTRPKLPTAIAKQSNTPMDLPAQIRLLNPLEKAGDPALPVGIDKNKPGEGPPSDKNPATSLIPPVNVGDPKDKGNTVGLGGDTVPGKTGEKGQPPAVPLPKLGQPPKDVKNPKDPKGPPKFNKGGPDDNSNSQFAMLALWAARRHEVPVENALLLAEQRYRTSQHKGADNSWSGWSYHYLQGDAEKPSMSCVGLLGLALGKGVAIEMQLKAGHAVPKVPMLDAQARDGFLKGVAPHLRKESINGPVFPVSLYFMWSVERVAVLYDLMKIGDQDWYLWGVDLLLPAQNAANGFWETRSYHGSNANVDTCFALLFLKRVNFVQDLTDLNLRLYMAIPESNSMPK